MQVEGHRHLHLMRRIKASYKYFRKHHQVHLSHRNHHERWDGMGYPGLIDMKTGKTIKKGKKINPACGKKADKIPIFGRIVALADVYDALCSRRVYKKAWAEEKVLETIREESGKHFDPEIVDAFLMHKSEFKRILEKRSPSRIY